MATFLMLVSFGMLASCLIALGYGMVMLYLASSKLDRTVKGRQDVS